MSIPSSYSQGSIGGGSSPRGDVKFTYLGYTQTKNSYQLLTQVTYQGTKQELQYRRDNDAAWAIGTNDTNYGRLESVVIQQEAGPFWHAVISYNKVLNNGVTISSGDENKPQQTNLDVSMFSMPIEKHPNYDYRWNHYLVCTSKQWMDDYLLTHNFPAYGDYSTRMTEQMAMQIYDDCSNKKYDERLDVLWILDLNERPKDPLTYLVTRVNPINDNVQVIGTQAFPWMVYFKAMKPGVSYYDLPTYTITENGRSEKRADCQWAITMGGQLAYPISGDFGIQKYYHPDNLTCQLSDVKGYWLCEGGQIDYDGKYYNANCKYTWSPELSGWDLDLYTFFSGAQYYQQKSIINPNPILTTTNTSIFDGYNNNHGNISNPILSNNNSEGD